MCDVMDTEPAGEHVDDLSRVQRDCLNDSTDDDSAAMELVVTQLPDAVFDDEEVQAEFEAVFNDVDSHVIFTYMKIHHEAHVHFDSVSCATQAHIQSQDFSFIGSNIKCYWAKLYCMLFGNTTKQTDEVDDCRMTSQYLQPPERDKQFLISPPGSPPTGWEPVNEREPALNYDLISALTHLAPGETHEVQAPSPSRPGIIVHVCEDPQNFKKRPKIVPMRTPHAMP